MNLRLLTLLIAACLASALCACESQTKYPPAWKTDEVRVASERLLWEVTVFALDKEKFPVGSQMDPTTLTALSGWRNSLAPFRGKGRRERAEVRYEPLGPNLYRVMARVEREINDDYVQPMDLSYAKWESAPDNQEAALVLIQRIRSWIEPGFEMRKADNKPTSSGD